MCDNIKDSFLIREITKTNNRISDVGYSIGLSNNDVRGMQYAYMAALNSDFDNYKIGCAIMHKGRLIGSGYNSSKTNPAQKEYNLKYRNFETRPKFSNREHSLHAELSAIKSIKTKDIANINMKKVKAYVYRISPGLPQKQGLAKPCPACAHHLFDLGIKEVYYSDRYGFGRTIYNECLMEMDCNK